MGKKNLLSGVSHGNNSVDSIYSNEITVPLYLNSKVQMQRLAKYISDALLKHSTSGI